jgi:hypothetical protein
VPCRIFARKREYLTYSIRNGIFVRTIKFEERLMGGTCRVHEERSSACELSIWKSKGGDHLEDLGVDGY